MTSDDFADASLSVFTGVSVLIATRAEDGASHPGGIEFIAALGWRGVVYGAADELLLRMQKRGLRSRFSTSRSDRRARSGCGQELLGRVV
jgi:hypothetical protein